MTVFSAHFRKHLSRTGRRPYGVLLARQPSLGLKLVPDEWPRDVEAGTAIADGPISGLVFVARNGPTEMDRVRQAFKTLKTAPTKIVVALTEAELRRPDVLAECLTHVPEQPVLLVIVAEDGFPLFRLFDHFPSPPLGGDRVLEEAPGNPLRRDGARLRAEAPAIIGADTVEDVLSLSSRLMRLADLVDRQEAVERLSAVRLALPGLAMPDVLPAVPPSRPRPRYAVPVLTGAALGIAASIATAVPGMLTLASLPDAADQQALIAWTETPVRVWPWPAVSGVDTAGSLVAATIIPALLAEDTEDWRALLSQNGGDIEDALSRVERLELRRRVFETLAEGGEQAASALLQLRGIIVAPSALAVYPPWGRHPLSDDERAKLRDRLVRLTAEASARRVAAAPHRLRLQQVAELLDQIDDDPLSPQLQRLPDALQAVRSAPPVTPPTELFARLAQTQIGGVASAVAARREWQIWSDALTREREALALSGFGRLENRAVELAASVARLSDFRESWLSGAVPGGETPVDRYQQLETDLSGIPEAAWRERLRTAALQALEPVSLAWVADQFVNEDLEAPALLQLRRIATGSVAAAVETRLVQRAEERLQALDSAWRATGAYQPDETAVTNWDGSDGIGFALLGVAPGDYVALRYRLFFDREKAVAFLETQVVPLLSRIAELQIAPRSDLVNRWQGALSAWSAFQQQRGSGAIGALDSFLVDEATAVTAARCAVDAVPTGTQGGDQFSRAGRELAEVIALRCRELIGNP